MLQDNLKVLLASTFSYYIKSAFFHWNVTGIHFVSLHSLFGAIYEDAQGAIDTIAEEIRTLDSHAPGSLSRFQELSIIEDQTQIPRYKLMIEELLHDTEKMIDLVTSCFESATAAAKEDIANNMAERLAAHSKYRWQLKSLLEEDGE
jgi:starvation-inducible DNA-binding protein